MDDYKVALSNLFKAAKDFKVAGLIVLIFFIIYMIGYETVWVNSWKEITKVSTSIDEQKKMLEDKKSKQEQYQKWENELKQFDNSVVAIDQSTSAQSASVKHSRRVEALAKGMEESTLPEPHNKRTILSNKLDKFAPYKIPENAQGTEMSSGTSSIEFERFDYTLELAGTYVGLLDFINHLAILNPLVAINSVDITPYEAFSDGRPDPELNPNFPLRLKMKVQYSIFLQQV